MSHDDAIVPVRQAFTDGESEVAASVLQALVRHVDEGGVIRATSPLVEVARGILRSSGLRALSCGATRTLVRDDSYNAESTEDSDD